MTENNQEIKNIIEAAILAADQPISVRKLLALFPEDAQPSSDDIRAVIAELQADTENRGVELCRIGNGYRYQSREQYASWLRRLRSTRPPRYSRALLETLAIIAYRQPVTRGDIEDIRGVSVNTETMRTLLNREWVHCVGQKEVPGRPSLYATTKGFLEYFNLKSISQLPELADIREIYDVARDNNINLPEELAARLVAVEAQDGMQPDPQQELPLVDSMNGDKSPDRENGIVESTAVEALTMTVEEPASEEGSGVTLSPPGEPSPGSA